jgi:hypothetical protein
MQLEMFKYAYNHTPFRVHIHLKLCALSSDVWLGFLLLDEETVVGVQELFPLNWH